MDEKLPLLGKAAVKRKPRKVEKEKKVGLTPNFEESFAQQSAEEFDNIQKRITGREKRPHSRRFRSIPHLPPTKPRYVTSVCTAREFKMKELKEYFENHNFEVIDSSEVLFTCYKSPSSSTEEDEAAEVFFFQYGVVVWWGPSDSWGKLMVLGMLKNFEVKPEESIDLEVCDYSYAIEAKAGEEQWQIDESEPDEDREERDIPVVLENTSTIDSSTILNDHFILANRSWEVKLAFSHGLAQSAKLTVFEERIDKVIEDTRKYPEYLAEHGKVELTRKEIAMLKGKLFLHRMDINLHSDILDTPDFFWEHTNLEPLYFKCRKNMEINKRVEILNQRLDVVHELFSMLSDELNQKHSAKLEWIIIWLILIEVIVGIMSIATTFVPAAK